MRKEYHVNLFKEQISIVLKNKRVKLDCGHYFSDHQFSNVLVMHPKGKIECSACYQSENIY